MPETVITCFDMDRPSLVPLAVTLLALVAVYWLSRSEGPPPPVAWHVGDVDPRFRVDMEAVKAAAMGAEHVWEDASHQDLLVEDAQRGVLVRLVFDERLQGEQRAWVESRRFEKDRAELASRARSLERENERYRMDLESARLEAETWKRRERSPLTWERMEKRREALENLGRSLEIKATELTRDQERLARVMAAPSSLPPAAPTEGASYDERTHELVVRTYSTPAELEWAIAHGFGHAIGISTHVAEPDALMAPIPTDTALVRHALHPADLEALAALGPRTHWQILVEKLTAWWRSRTSET